MRRSVATAFAVAAMLGIAATVRAAVPTVVGGTDYALALSKDGKVYAWGGDHRGQLGSGRALYASTPSKVAGMPPIVHVDGGASHVAAVDWVGKVWTWGRDGEGQLGRRASAGPTRPGQVVGVSGVARVAASRTFTAALRSNGTVLVWGTFNGQRREPEAIDGLIGITDIRAGLGHIVALRSDGTVWTVGSNEFGELGDGTAGGTRAAGAQVAGLAGITRIGAGPCGSMALRNDGVVLAWGRAACAATAPRYTPTPVAGVTNVAELVGGFDHSHAVLLNGSVVHWDNAYAPATRPGLLAVSQLAADTGLETLARLANDTAIVIGRNDLGQHGQGDTGEITGTSLVNLLNVTAVATAHADDGGITQYARAANGDLYAWGSDAAGQLGTGAELVASVPHQVAGLPEIVRVAAGDLAAYAVDVDGFAWAWGDNGGYALGDGSVTPRSAPAKIAGLAGVRDVAAGRRFALFLMDDGTVRSLGDLFGNGVDAPPVLVPGLVDIASIAARGGNAYAIDTTGAAFGWGRGQDGMVGDGATLDRATPVPIAGFDAPVSSIAAGATHALARTADGGAWSWGHDTGTGALGDGVAGAHTRTAPARIAGMASALAVAAGDGHSLALLGTGEASSWGTAALGDGAIGARNVPGPVATITGIAGIAAARFAAWAVGADGAAYAWGGAILPATASAEPGATTGDGTFVYRGAPVLVWSDGAQGTLDASDWFLDLDATVANTVPPELVPRMLAVARAAPGARSVSLDASIHFRAADAGRNVATYVVGYVPPEFLAQAEVAPALPQPRLAALVASGDPVLVQLTEAGWSPFEGTFIAWSRAAVAGPGRFENVLNGVDPQAIPGARFCIGYGEDGASMLASGTLAEVIAIEPAASAPSAVPCFPRGVYIDGPPVSALGSPVAFNVAVVGLDPAGAVQFRDGFANLGTPQPLTAGGPGVGRTSLSAMGLVLGTHAIGAAYPGDSRNAAASTAIPVLHVVSAPAGGIAVNLHGATTSLAGTEATFTATVTGNQPAGPVQFRDGTTSLGAAVPLVGGVAMLRTSALAPGPHALTAVYAGDAANPAKTSNSFSHVVATTITYEVTVEATPLVPKVGTPVTLTATVTGPVLAGPIQFYDRGVELGKPILQTTGNATLTTDALASGSHLITAVFTRDLFNRATSAPLALGMPLALDPAYPNADSDFDGIPNPVELDVARNPFAKDNDIFGDARLFTMQQYRDFLGREGDEGGVGFWSGELDAGTRTRPQVIENYFSSPEFQGTVAPVARLYFAYFLRIPDYSGLLFWIDRYRAGIPLGDISDFFATSAEFASTYGALNNGRFVQLVYKNVLGRDPDQVGLDFWIAQLNSGALTRGQLMAAFSESPEYRGLIANEVYVTMMYVGMLRRSPDPDGFAFWVTYLDTDNPGLVLIGGFLDSPEYRARFLP